MKKDFFVFQGGQRLDRWLVAALGIPRNQIQQYIKEERILVNKLKSKRSYKVCLGDHIEYFPPLPKKLVAQDLDVEIIYKDDDIIVVNKAPNFVVHPAPGHHDTTLVNALLPYIEKGTGDPMRPGIVHRLDKGTSGVLIVARNPKAYTALVAQFSQRSIERKYLALIWGAPKHTKGFIEAPIGRSPHNRKRMAVVESGKYAKTNYTVIEQSKSNPPISLVSCKLETGRTHQIRVHMLHKHHPIVCDPTYSFSSPPHFGKTFLAKIDRPLLHAQTLGFMHPCGIPMMFSSDPPQDFLSVLSWLKFSIPT